MKYATLLIAAVAANDKKICKDSSSATGYATLKENADVKAATKDAAACKAACDKVITADTKKADKDFCCHAKTENSATVCDMYSITKQATWATLLKDETAATGVANAAWDYAAGVEKKDAKAEDSASSLTASVLAAAAIAMAY